MADDSDITISINGVSHPILCGLCKAKVSFIGEPKDKTGQVGCARCRNVDSAQQVAKMAVEYAKDEGQLMFNRLARDTASQSSFMSFKGKTQHNKTHRFTVELKL